MVICLGIEWIVVCGSEEGMGPSQGVGDTSRVDSCIYVGILFRCPYF